MITIKIEKFRPDLWGSSIRDKITFTCPLCATVNTFYSISPFFCIKCQCKLPNVENLVKNTEMRIDYRRSFGKEGNLIV
jgi:hypothetical protein